MNIIVCLKYCASMVENPVGIFPFSPSDMSAFTFALQLKKTIPDTKVFVLSMGSRQASLPLKDCYSYDADEVFLVTDPCYAGSDTLATTYILSKAIEQIRKTHPVDMILCGNKTSDSGTGQVGPGLAFRLQFFYFDLLEEFLYSNHVFTMMNKTCSATWEGGGVVATVRKSSMLPFPSMASIMKARHRDIIIWTNDDLALEKDRVGLCGSPTRILKIEEYPFLPKPGNIVHGTLDQLSNQLREQIIIKKNDVGELY